MLQKLFSKIQKLCSYAGIVAFESKIYILGGINSSAAVLNSADEFDTENETWRTLTNMPVALQGAIAEVSGESIYLIGGSVTNTSTSSIPNIVYKLTPNLGSSGIWETLTTSSTIPARNDLSGYSYNGTIYFNGGRFNDGSLQLTSDAYISAGNTTTTLVEASLNSARFGAGAVCYKPKASDPYPNDKPGMFLLGGSTLANTNQPPSAILSSTAFDYYETPSSTNTVQSGNPLPKGLYSPGLGISYLNRKLYIFGGANIVNVPLDSIYSMTFLQKLTYGEFSAGRRWFSLGHAPKPVFQKSLNFII